MPRYVKLTAKDNKHYDFIYREGLNCDTKLLNYKECESGGLHFTDIENWTYWINYNDSEMYWIWDCEPVGEILNFGEKRKYKAQGIVLRNPKCIWDYPIFQLEIVKRYGYYIKNISNPLEIIQLEAVKQDGGFINYIKNPTNLVQLKAVENDGCAIKYISNPSEEVQLVAVKKHGLAIKFIKNPTNYVKETAKSFYQNNYNNSINIQLIMTDFIEYNLTEELKIDSVKKDGNLIKYIIHPSENIQLAAVKQNGLAIDYISLCFNKDVYDDGWVRYVPSEAVQLAAVKQNGLSIICIKNPSDKIKLAAIMQNEYCIKYIKNLSEDLQLIAVKRDGMTIQFINNPSEKIKNAAIKQNVEAKHYF
jgi:hypothetical protein